MNIESIGTRSIRSQKKEPPEGSGAVAAMVRARLLRALFVLAALLVVTLALAIWIGHRLLDLTALSHDLMAQSILLRLRLPRVLLAAIIGASLATAGTALQALFRNPLADPFSLGVTGGGMLGASLAIALGWGMSVSGVPLVFLAAFIGSCISMIVVYQLAHTGAFVMPGTLLLAGVVMNLVAGAGVIIIQYVADYTRALQILRWTVGSLDIIGFDLICRMLVFLVPGWIVLLASARNLHLLAMGEETAASLGVNVRRCERLIYAAASLVVGVSVAVAGAIAFVGLIVPHAVRLLFGEDVRIVLPCSFLLGATFLILADALARTVLESSELPVGAVTALLGGITFFWLLRRRQRYSAML